MATPGRFDSLDIRNLVNADDWEAVDECVKSGEISDRGLDYNFFRAMQLGKMGVARYFVRVKGAKSSTVATLCLKEGKEVRERVFELVREGLISPDIGLSGFRQASSLEGGLEVLRELQAGFFPGEYGPDCLEEAYFHGKAEVVQYLTGCLGIKPNKDCVLAAALGGHEGLLNDLIYEWGLDYDIGEDGYKQVAFKCQPSIMKILLGCFKADLYGDSCLIAALGNPEMLSYLIKDVVFKPSPITLVKVGLRCREGFRLCLKRDILGPLDYKSVLLGLATARHNPFLCGEIDIDGGPLNGGDFDGPLDDFFEELPSYVDLEDLLRGVLDLTGESFGGSLDDFFDQLRYDCCHPLRKSTQLRLLVAVRLIDLGANPNIDNGLPLRSANDPILVRALLNRGADPRLMVDEVSDDEIKAILLDWIVRYYPPLTVWERLLSEV